MLWLELQGDRDLTEVTTQDLRAYLNYMRTEYTPRRITGNNDRKLASKTIRNIWINLSGFFTWASLEFEIPNPMKGVPAPKFVEPHVEPLTKDEIEALLKAVDFRSEAKTRDRRKFRMRRPTAPRPGDYIDLIGHRTTSYRIMFFASRGCGFEDGPGGGASGGGRRGQRWQGPGGVPGQDHPANRLALSSGTGRGGRSRRAVIP